MYTAVQQYNKVKIIDDSSDLSQQVLYTAAEYTVEHAWGRVRSNAKKDMLSGVGLWLQGVSRRVIWLFFRFNGNEDSGMASC